MRSRRWLALSCCLAVALGPAAALGATKSWEGGSDLYVASRVGGVGGFDRQVTDLGWTYQPEDARLLLSVYRRFGRGFDGEGPMGAYRVDGGGAGVGWRGEALELQYGLFQESYHSRSALVPARSASGVYFKLGLSLHESPHFLAQAELLVQSVRATPDHPQETATLFGVSTHVTNLHTGLLATGVLVVAVLARGRLHLGSFHGAPSKKKKAPAGSSTR